jgi:AAA family ATPase
MSNTQDTKTLEAKVRPWQNPKERTDLKGVARVHLSSHALQELGLKPEQTCYFWKAGEGPEARRQAIVWYSHENSMRKNVVQMSKTFQDACDLKLGDDLKIIASGNLAAAESIVLKDITAQEDNSKDLLEADRPIWESYIADSLCTLNTRIFLSHVAFYGHHIVRLIMKSEFAAFSRPIPIYAYIVLKE